MLWSFTVQTSDGSSAGKLLPFVFGIVLGLLIAIVSRPPIQLITAIAVCGTLFKLKLIYFLKDSFVFLLYHVPKTTVAPTNGAVSNQILAQTIVENAQIFFFSSRTNSVVHVVNIAKVDDIATLDTIEIAIKIATLASPLTVWKR